MHGSQEKEMIKIAVEFAQMEEHRQWGALPGRYRADTGQIQGTCGTLVGRLWGTCGADDAICTPVGPLRWPCGWPSQAAMDIGEMEATLERHSPLCPVPRAHA